MRKNVKIKIKAIVIILFFFFFFAFISQFTVEYDSKTHIPLSLFKDIAWLSLTRVHSGGTPLVKIMPVHSHLSRISTIVEMCKYSIRKYASAATKAQHILKKYVHILLIELNQHLRQKHCNKMNQKCIGCWSYRSQVEDNDIKYQKDTLIGR